jgi:hypothetical protein
MTIAIQYPFDLYFYGPFQACPACRAPGRYMPRRIAPIAQWLI